MDLAKWINLIYGALAWGLVIFLIDKQRLKELLPVGIVATLLLFIFQQFLFYLNLIKYNDALFFIAGIPGFQYLWAFASGIFVINYVSEVWIKKLPYLLLVTIGNQILTYIAIRVGNLSFMNGYNLITDTFITFVGICLGVWIAEGLFKERIHQNLINPIERC